MARKRGVGRGSGGKKGKISGSSDQLKGRARSADNELKNARSKKFGGRAGASYYGGVGARGVSPVVKAFKKGEAKFGTSAALKRAEFAQVLRHARREKKWGGVTESTRRSISVLREAVKQSGGVRGDYRRDHLGRFA